MLISTAFLMVCLLSAIGGDIKTKKDNDSSSRLPRFHCKCPRKTKVCKNGETPTYGATCSDLSKPRCPVNRCTKGKPIENKKKCPKRKKICADGKKPKFKKGKPFCKGSKPRCPRFPTIELKTTTRFPTYSSTTSKPPKQIRMHTMFEKREDIDVSTLKSCSHVSNIYDNYWYQ